MPRSRTLLAVALTALVALAACTSDDSPTEADGSRERQTTVPEPAVCPMTGEKPRGLDLGRPAVAVKVENSPLARPQSGLDKADLVYEEIVEGGITRFMAIYHCGQTTKAGPVRSARFDDPKIALPFTNVLAYSGANGIVENELARGKLMRLTELNTTGPLYRDPPGSTDTHSLFADVTRLRKIAKRRGKPKIPTSNFFKFDELPRNAAPAKSVRLNFNPSTVIEWRWRGGAWRRFEEGRSFIVASGKQIAVPNVLIQEVEVNNSATIVDVAGNPSPDIDLKGSGRAFLLRDAKVVKGTWRTLNEGKITRFETRRGDPFTFEVGRTWIELVPSKKGTVKGSIAISKK
jgi:hypothetical protein